MNPTGAARFQPKRQPGFQPRLQPRFQPGFQLWFATPQGLDRFDPAFLTGADQRRFNEMRDPRRREQFSLSRALLAHAAVPAASSSSLSHSGAHAALACGPAGYALGVDIEQYRRRDMMSIAQFAFSDREISALLALPEPQRERLFYLLWVMKEALAKALQLPLLEALRSCTFLRQGQGWSAVIPTRRRWSVLAFEPRPDISLAIAWVASEDLAMAGTDPGIGIEIREWPLPPGSPGGANWSRLAAIGSNHPGSDGEFFAAVPQNPTESSTCRTMLPTT